ncbi:MAG: DnaJ domain-containing protein [Caldilinea sp.]|nr:DnaJ domain-containing protein [Caldilinea sp.]MCB9114941.1 DnaJ domain-containing protein [Caldilineaceae bacterium]MCB9126280.1 DnaJ domain-containing protein [Caldilineaceae bacterium]MCO5214143.1 DnaJ domain-containing protein [Caldilinea sp.]MCW5843957.1 DnaJ domain-containing protein [Caldilinea sp.]
MAAPPVDHYEVLGVATTAGDDEIRRRYRFLALAFHPDRYSRNPEHHQLAEQQIKRINEAYRVLSDPAARAQFDTARQLLDSTAAARARSNLSVYASSLQDTARAAEQVRRAEHELRIAREQRDAALHEKATLQAQLAELGHLHAGERSTQAAELSALAKQVDQLTRERDELASDLKATQERSGRRVERLKEELERKNRLVERLQNAKSQWESSSQNRTELLTQRVDRLREELASRDRQLADALAARQLAQDQLAQERRSATRTTQSYSSALGVSEIEAARLQVELDALNATQQRSRTIMRLWQIAAIIGIANTVILIVLVLQRLGG